MQSAHTKSPRPTFFLCLLLVPGLIAASLTFFPTNARAALVFAIPMVSDGSTYTVELGQEFSVEAFLSDLAYGAFFRSDSTLNNYGIISATSDDSVAYGTFLLDSSTLANSGTISATSDSGPAFGVRSGSGGILTNFNTISATSTSGAAYGAYLDTSSTLTNSGSISATSTSGTTYGACLDTSSLTNSGSISATSTSGTTFGVKADSVSTLINYDTISATSTSGAAYGTYLFQSSTLTNSSSISGTSTSGTTYGAYLYSSSTLTNSGSISATSASGAAYGAYLDTSSTLTNSSSISGTSTSGAAYGAELYTSSLTNSGSISGTSTSGTAYGAELYSSSLTNSGSISGTSTSNTAYGVFSLNSTLTNSGTISARGATGSYAIYAGSGSTINLETGTRILNGSVFSEHVTNELNITSANDLEFVLAGTWWDISHSGTGAWTLASGSEANTNSFTLAPGSTMIIPTDSSLNVNGTASLKGTLLVDPSADRLGTVTILKAGTLTTGPTYETGHTLSNPNFKVNITTSDTSVTATTSYTPKADTPSLAATATLSSAKAFASVAQTRSLTILSDAGTKTHAGDIQVASNGSLTGLLDDHGPERQWSIFVQPVYSSSSRDSSTEDEGYDANMAGLETGIDRHFGDGIVLGAMIGIGAGTIDFKGSEFLDNDSENQRLYTTGVYGGYSMGDWLFTDTLNVTYATHHSSRNAGLSQTAKGDYNSWLTTNQTLAVYKWRPSEQWEIAPRAGLNISYLHREGFSETGAVNAVSYKDLDKVFADGLLSLRVSRTGLQLGDTLVTPYVGAGVNHSLGNNDITVRQYLATTSAQVTTENDTDHLTSECGVTFRNGATSFTVAYSGEYGETTDSHTLFGLLRWAF